MEARTIGLGRGVAVVWTDGLRVQLQRSSCQGDGQLNGRLAGRSISVRLDLVVGWRMHDSRPVQ